MAKFCGKCGSKLDEATGLCPNCDADKQTKETENNEPTKIPYPGQTEVPEDKPFSRREAKKALKKQKRDSMTTGQKVRRSCLKVLLCLIAVVVLLSGSIVVLVYYDVLDIPAVEDFLIDTGIKSSPGLVLPRIGDSYVPNPENIVYNNENKSSGYVNNILLVFFLPEASEEDIAAVVEKMNGTIVGKIDSLYQYQIEIEPMEYDELYEYSLEVSHYEGVNYVLIDKVFSITLNDMKIPNDPWKDYFQGFFHSLWGVGWDEDKPDGYNWWIEAVKVPSAWAYCDKMQPINIGIADNGFDVEHDDLEITVINSDENNFEDHGTHVSGIIGATINNKKGISGIVELANLYGVDCYITSEQENNGSSTNILMAGIEKCIDYGCKVVNLSSGVTYKSATQAAEDAVVSAIEATKALIIMLNYHDDFIIVQAAGNGDENVVGVDAQKYSGIFASITSDIIMSELELMEKGNYKFNHEITVEDVQNAYMVVGAVDKERSEDNWQLATFSNYGDAVTVCAPGVEIFSTVVTGGWDGNYEFKSGTSMAAPIVSGIVAMVWSIDPTMSAEQVQNIIQSTADQSVLSRNEDDTGTYSMINAKAAVEKAIEVLEEKENSNEAKSVRNTSGERDVVLVLDTSGSMRGDPISHTKTASSSFIKTILDEDASIGIATYANEASMPSDFSVDEDLLIDSVLSLWGDGGTNIEAGLAEAYSMLDTSNAKKKIIVLMSDGEPNVGKEGDDLVAYADDIKDDGVTIYTLGFFESLNSNKAAAQALMEKIASDGCHYEVADAKDLVFFFGDVADQINGQKYIYIRIACPVDVSVTYNGETLSSAEDNLNTRTDFGTLTFEDNEEANSNEDDKVKVLRLKEGADYDIEIVGTGHGLVDLTFGFMDENGEYSDFRYFEDVKITKNTVIHATATVSDETVVNIDNDGDGKYDLKLRAEENGSGEEVKAPVLLYVVMAAGTALVLIVIFKVRKHRKYSNTKENY